MNGPSGVYALWSLLAQCPCGGGERTRISYWAAFIPVAAAFLCGLAYDRYTRRKAKSIESEQTERQDDAQEHHEE